jgi:hypothetical protein
MPNAGSNSKDDLVGYCDACRRPGHKALYKLGYAFAAEVEETL